MCIVGVVVVKVSASGATGDGENTVHVINEIDDADDNYDYDPYASTESGLPPEPWTEDNKYHIRDGATEEEYFAALAEMPCDIPIIDAVAIDEEMLTGGGEHVELARSLLSKGYPFVTRGNELDEPFWHADNLEKVLPEWFDREEGLITAHEDYVRAILRAHYSTPSFLTKDGVGPDLFSEFLFRAKKAQANSRHIDEGCESSYSLQMRGWKLWELDLPWNDTAGPGPHGDGKLRCVLRPGDALFFYAGWYHRTMPITDDESVAISMYFHNPIVSHEEFYANFGDKLLAPPYYCDCLGFFKPAQARNVTAVAESLSACDVIRKTTDDPTFMDDLGTDDPDMADSCPPDASVLRFADPFEAGK